MRELRDAALRYAGAGLRVLPVWPVREGVCACGNPRCTSQGKHPLASLTPNGVKDASSDPEVVAHWWDRIPDANVAIATGATSGIFVLDIDNHKGGGEAVLELSNRVGGLDGSWVARTPKGGTHLFWRHPGAPVRNTVEALGKGLDIRGDGGFVVVAPSATTAGKYSWEVPPNGTPGDAPSGLVALVTAGGTTPLDPLDFKELLDGVPEGRRDATLFRWAARLRGAGVDLTTAETLISFAALKCEPPFDGEVAKDKVRRAYRDYPVEFDLTDLGNAERMVYRHGQDLRYSVEGYWLVWDGARWRRDPGTLLVLTYAQDTIRSITAEARALVGNDDVTREKRLALYTHAARSAATERVKAMLYQAAPDPTILVEPGDLDADPWLLNVRNGTLDLVSGTLRPHSQDDLITKLAGVRFDPEATCPQWDAFLEQMLPDPAVRSFLGRAAGYSLTGVVREHAMFFPYGPSRTGKSTVANILLKLMGEYGIMGTPDLLLSDKSDSHPTGLADLAGIRYVPTIEVGDGKRLAESQFKWMTGGDRLKARRMRENYFEFTPTFKLWMVANHRPLVKGGDKAVWQRIYMIPFTVQIPYEDRDLELPEKLGTELPGILNWALRGFREWLEHRLDPPEPVRAATQEYENDMDILGAFLTECTTLTGNREDVLAGPQLYACYRAWCEGEGIHSPITKIALTRALKEQGYKVKDMGSNRIGWEGLALTDAGKTVGNRPRMSDSIDVRDLLT